MVTWADQASSPSQPWKGAIAKGWVLTHPRSKHTTTEALKGRNMPEGWAAIPPFQGLIITSRSTTNVALPALPQHSQQQRHLCRLARALT